jgi:hypothetical protein
LPSPTKPAETFIFRDAAGVPITEARDGDHSSVVVPQKPRTSLIDDLRRWFRDALHGRRAADAPGRTFTRLLAAQWVDCYR